jgi:PPOX class probable FMN-dependent enzyme
MQFEEVITTPERMREFVTTRGRRSAVKDIDHIDDICRRFIAACPFVVIGSHGADGRFDLSPKGDPPGFVTVLDDHTLAIPDRLGNGRLDTFENLLVRPEIGLFFLIPGHADTLRVSGKGRIVRDRALQDRMAVNGKEPLLVLIVDVEQAFMHCPKCVIRSRLWKPEEWPDLSDVPTVADALLMHTGIPGTLAEIQATVENDGITRLY